MIAQCSHCKSTFETDRFGQQRCPSCDKDVFVVPPAGTGLPTTPSENAYAAPETSAAPLPLGPDAIPWERRHELGLFNAYFQTLKLALGEPTRLFTRMKYDELDGAHLYFALVVIVPWLISLPFAALFSPNSEEQVAKLHELIDMGLPIPHALLSQLEQSMQRSPFLDFFRDLFVVPLVSFAVLYLLAGTTHLTLIVFNKAQHGWTATLKAFIYAFSPGVLMVVPVCGGILTLCWATGLQIIGLSKAQRISSGFATVGVLGPQVLASCGCVCGSIAFASMIYNYFIPQ
jgi:hypothetical protein